MTNTTRRFFDDGPDAICIADGQFNVQHVNAAFERLLGYTREDLRGSPVWNIVATSRRESAEYVLRSIPDEGIKRVWPFVAKDGTSKSFAIHLIRSPSGSHLTTLREVTEDLVADRKRLSAERALSFLEYAPIPMYEIDGGGHVTLWNAAISKLFGIPADDAIGNRSLDLLQSDMTSDVILKLQKDLNTNGRAEYSGWYQRRNGPPVYCTWTFVLMHDDAGKTLGVAVTGIDMTESISRERDLQKSLEIIRAQRDDLRALSTPILEVWQNVLALPVIGTLDEARAGELMYSLLDAISTRDCRFAILDMTGVAGIDESSAMHMVSILRAITLLGATGIVTGLRPMTAKTMVDSGIDFPSVATFPTLQAGLRHCLNELRRTSTSTSRDTREKRTVLSGPRA